MEGNTSSGLKKRSLTDVVKDALEMGDCISNLGGLQATFSIPGNMGALISDPEGVWDDHSDSNSWGGKSLLFWRV